MKTVAGILAEVEAAKAVAMKKFESDWGTKDISKVMHALRKTIPGSVSPMAAALAARKLLP